MHAVTVQTRQRERESVHEREAEAETGAEKMRIYEAFI